jgi:Arc/MetJ family transcription regulator
MNLKELSEKLRDNTEWMIEHLSLADKIAFISPVEIEIDDDFVIWTLKLYDGQQVVSTRLEDAVDVAVKHTNKEIDREVIAAAQRKPSPTQSQPGDVEIVEPL